MNYFFVAVMVSLAVVALLFTIRIAPYPALAAQGSVAPVKANDSTRIHRKEVEVSVHGGADYRASWLQPHVIQSLWERVVADHAGWPAVDLISAPRVEIVPTSGDAEADAHRYQRMFEQYAQGDELVSIDPAALYEHETGVVRAFWGALENSPCILTSSDFTNLQDFVLYHEFCHHLQIAGAWFPDDVYQENFTAKVALAEGHACTMTRKHAYRTGRSVLYREFEKQRDAGFRKAGEVDAFGMQDLFFYYVHGPEFWSQITESATIPLDYFSSQGWPRDKEILHPASYPDYGYGLTDSRKRIKVHFDLVLDSVRSGVDRVVRTPVNFVPIRAYLKKAVGHNRREVARVESALEGFLGGMREQYIGDQEVVGSVTGMFFDDPERARQLLETCRVAIAARGGAIDVADDGIYRYQVGDSDGILWISGCVVSDLIVFDISLDEVAMVIAAKEASHAH